MKDGKLQWDIQPPDKRHLRHIIRQVAVQPAIKVARTIERLQPELFATISASVRQAPSSVGIGPPDAMPTINVNASKNMQKQTNQK